MTKRRELLIALGSGALAWSGVVRGQSKQPILIGWLHTGSRESTHFFAAFKEGLAALGWKEGSQVVIEARWADGQEDRLQPLAEELLAKRPAIFVTAAVRATIVAAKVAPKVPIVQATGSSLVTSGLAKSLARPGGMVTGLLNFTDDVFEKYLELLLAAAPRVKRVGFLIDPAGPNFEDQMKSARRSAKQYRIEARFAEAAKAEELEAAISRLARDKVQGLVIVPSSLFSAESARIPKLALAHRWPAIGNLFAYVEHGALLSYGPDTTLNFRRAAYFVDRILKGTYPGDLPIEQPTKFEFVINMKTARLLGIEISPELAVRATKVIE